MTRPLIMDTDTAGDDVQALLLACLTDRLSVEAVTIVAGNVPFDRQVENAKHTLSLVGAADTPVYEGARAPLLKDFHHIENIQGEGGLGGDRFPDTGTPSAEGFAPAGIVRRCRAAPGEHTLLCLGPLTNFALALAREPALPGWVDEVWAMGGAVHCAGNVTPAAEYNVWVDPNAAKRVFDAFEVTLVDWGLTLRASVLPPAGGEAVQAMDGAVPELIEGIVETVYEFTRTEQRVDGVPQSDTLTAALLAYPTLRGEMGTYPVEVDERAGLTRGYLSVDVDGVTGAPARTWVVESADGERFLEVVLSLLRDRAPDLALSAQGNAQRSRALDRIVDRYGGPESTITARRPRSSLWRSPDSSPSRPRPGSARSARPGGPACACQRFPAGRRGPALPRGRCRSDGASGSGPAPA